jgi:hypothetical protein
MLKHNRRIAIEELQKLITELKELSGLMPFSAEHTRWLMKTNKFIADIFGQNSSYLLSIKKINWKFVGQRFVNVYEMSEIDMGQAKYDRYQFESAIVFAEGILLAALDELKDKKIEQLYDGKDTSQEASEILKIINLIEHKLRKIIREIPNNEKEVQNSVESLLIATDIEHQREFPVINYSSKNYIPDFSFIKQSLVVEIKFCNRKGREKELIAEINDDIMAYQQEFSNLIFLIYDLGHIRDIDAFSAEFEKKGSIFIKIIKH